MSALSNAAPQGVVNSAGLNPITVEVIGSAFESIVDEMGEALVRASYSTNIKERRDCSTALFDAQGTTLCQAEHIPIHLGSFLAFIPLIMARYPLGDIRPGDVFIGNDAYEGGGTHLPDIVLAEPVFFEGTLVAWTINTAHHTDFADRGHAHIFQEGLRIPPVRFYREGVLQEDVQRLILLNCQVPDQRLSDFRAQMAANRLGVTRVTALYEKYGADIVHAAGRELQDYAERKLRAGIREIPDGTYKFTEAFDLGNYAELVDVSVAVTIAGDEVELDFYEAPPQLRDAFNMVETALLASIYFVIKAVIDPTIPPNSGIARAIRVKAPLGSVLNSVAPAAVHGRATTGQRVVDLVLGAFSHIIPERVTAASNGNMAGGNFMGYRPDGSTWIYGETIGGGNGARYNKDGLDGAHAHLTNTSNLPIEALENEYPLTIMRYELVDGSGGAGTFRGGMGIRRVYRAEAECRTSVGTGGSRARTRAWGLNGGLSGDVGYARVFVGEGPEIKPSGAVARGDIVEVVTPGAGGYGPPSGRNRVQVQKDIRDNVFSRESALEIFGDLAR